jgi:opacity protein-like surface antigen
MTDPRPHRLAAAALLALAAAGAQAQAVTDPKGDILPTFAGTAGGDVDVVMSLVQYDTMADTFTFKATMADKIGTTPGALYIWGLDRGAGTERFVGGTPSIGAGVKFDLVVLLRPDGTGVVNDIVNAKATPLAAGMVKVAGNTIGVNGLAGSLFPSTGFTASNYTWNLWPRVGTGSNTQITDFAPDASNARMILTAVPEPQSWALMLGGMLLLAPAMLRRRPAAVKVAAGSQ